MVRRGTAAAGVSLLELRAACQERWRSVRVGDPDPEDPDVEASCVCRVVYPLSSACSTRTDSPTRRMHPSHSTCCRTARLCTTASGSCSGPPCLPLTPAAAIIRRIPSALRRPTRSAEWAEEQYAAAGQSPPRRLSTAARLHDASSETRDSMDADEAASKDRRTADVEGRRRIQTNMGHRSSGQDGSCRSGIRGATADRDRARALRVHLPRPSGALGAGPLQDHVGIRRGASQEVSRQRPQISSSLSRRSCMAMSSDHVLPRWPRSAPGPRVRYRYPRSPLGSVAAPRHRVARSHSGAAAGEPDRHHPRNGRRRTATSWGSESSHSDWLPMMAAVARECGWVRKS